MWQQRWRHRSSTCGRSTLSNVSDTHFSKSFSPKLLSGMCVPQSALMVFRRENQASPVESVDFGLNWKVRLRLASLWFF